MVLRLGPAFQHAQSAPGIERRLRHDFQQHRFADVVRAGACHEDSARREQSQCAQVDVLVTAHGAVDLFARLGERRRVENDRVEIAARRRITRQDFEDVGLAKRHVRDVVCGGVPFRGGQSGGARIDGLDLLAGSAKDAARSRRWR